MVGSAEGSIGGGIKHGPPRRSAPGRYAGRPKRKPFRRWLCSVNGLRGVRRVPALQSGEVRQRVHVCGTGVEAAAFRPGSPWAGASHRFGVGLSASGKALVVGRVVGRGIGTRGSIAVHRRRPA